MRDDQLLVAGSKISGTAAMPLCGAPGVQQSGQLVAPETASMRPSGSFVSVGYQRPYAICWTSLHVFVAGSKIVALRRPTYASTCPPTTRMRPSASGVWLAQKRFAVSL